MGMDVYGTKYAAERDAVWERIDENSEGHGRDEIFSELRKVDDLPGAYFRNTAWWWSPLAAYIVRFAPEVAKRIRIAFSDSDRARMVADGDTYEAITEREAESVGDLGYWHSNDGAGLSEDDALVLAGVLTVHIETGQTAAYAAGVAYAIDRAEKDYRIMRSIRSNGETLPEKLDAFTPFTVDNVAKFRDFLRGSGGFAIR